MLVPCFAYCSVLKKVDSKRRLNFERTTKRFFPDDNSPSPESASELCPPSDHRMSAKLVPTFADRGCNVVSAADPYGRILVFLDRSRHCLFQIASQLYLRGWVDHVPDGNTFHYHRCVHLKFFKLQVNLQIFYRIPRMGKKSIAGYLASQFDTYRPECESSLMSDQHNPLSMFRIYWIPSRSQYPAFDSLWNFGGLSIFS
jgi:hypothetical protein